MTTLDLNLEHIKKTYSYKQDPEAFLDAAASVMAQKARNLYNLPNLPTPDVAIIKSHNNELGIDPNSVNAAYAQGSSTAGSPQIYVTDGLTRLPENQALAALGHEIGHQVLEEQRAQNGDAPVAHDHGHDHSTEGTPEILTGRDEQMPQHEPQIIVFRTYSDGSAEIVGEDDLMALLQFFIMVDMIDPNSNPLQIMMGDDAGFAQDNSPVPHDHSLEAARQEELDSDEIAGELTGNPALVKETLRAVDSGQPHDPNDVHPALEDRISNIDEHFGLKRYS